jgi:hypothetical protein
MPGRGYTIDRIAETIDRFTEVVGFDRFTVYVFDYGAAASCQSVYQNAAFHMILGELSRPSSTHLGQAAENSLPTKRRL